MYERILVPLDGGPVAEAGLEEAIRLAQRCNAALRLLHVVDPNDFANGFETPRVYQEEVVPHMQSAGRQLLEHARQRAAARGVVCDACVVEATRTAAADAVLRQAAAWPADLIVLGTHGRRGLHRLILGSDAEAVARSAKIPVLLVRSQHEEPRSAP